jgi:hypothetical protein
MMLLVSVQALSAQDAAAFTRAYTIDTLNVRVAPGRDNPAITRLSPRTEILIEARNRIGDWLLIRTPDAAVRGWVATRFVDTPNGFDLGALAISEEIFAAPAPAANAATGDVAAPSADAAAMQATVMLASLQNIPIVPSISANAVAVYQRARRANQANVLAKVGDCNTENYAFLAPLDVDNYNLGPYADLQQTVSFFRGSYSRQSVAGKVGFSAVSALDALWADPTQCAAGESPFWCELRATDAAVVVIMFGSNDVAILDGETYRAALQRQVTLALRHRSLPILSTFTGAPSERLFALNMITVEVAQQYDVPLINFWRAAQSLPNFGMAGDGLHLTYSGSPTVSFNGEENQYGFSMRNLVTLQTLDALRRAAG